MAWQRRRSTSGEATCSSHAESAFANVSSEASQGLLISSGGLSRRHNVKFCAFFHRSVVDVLTLFCDDCGAVCGNARVKIACTGFEFEHNNSVANTYKQGEHICSIYDTEAEQLAIAAEYLSDGLRNGERCLYAAASRAADINASDAVRRGALIELTHAEAHLAGGRFDSERMLRLLNEAVESALNAGFKGLRTCGDMSWLLVECEGREQVIEYEALLNPFFKNVRGAGMCLYDRRKLPKHQIDGALATHPSVVSAGLHQDNAAYNARAGHRPRGTATAPDA